MGQKHLAVLTRVFFTRKRTCMAVLQGGQTKVAVFIDWRGGRKAGFHCIEVYTYDIHALYIDITKYPLGHNVWNYTLLRLIWSPAYVSYGHFWTQVTQGRPVSNADTVVPFVNGRCHFYNTWIIFDLVLRLFLLKRKNVASQGGTRTFRILISLPYHFTTSPIRQNYEKFKYTN